MDPYDVLGLRPQASEQEIELAYRGRRSQYHPDKYQGSDEQTLRWATSKMQEVNTAYAALTAGTSPAPGDACNPGTPAKSGGTDASRAAQVNPRSIMTLATYLGHTMLSDTQTVAMHFAPNIPEVKLHNALRAYAPGVPRHEVVVLVDETFWGSAKEGLLITNDRIYLSPKLSADRHIDLNSIRSLSADGRQLVVNGSAVAQFSQLELYPAMALMAQIDQYLTQRRLVMAGAPDHEPLPPALTQRLSAFLAEFVKPRFFDDASSEARKRKRTVGYWLGHEVDSQMLELVRFKLNFRSDESLLSLSSLAINGNDYFFCVTNCGVHSISLGRSHVFIGHGALSATSVSKLIQESVFVGIQLHSGERMLVSCRNATIRPYALELFTGIIALLNGREALTPDDGDGDLQVSASDKTAIFKIAKERLLDLCELIAPMEAESGRNLIDRNRAAQYFGVLDEALGDSEAQALAFAQLGQVALLCQAALNCAGNSPLDLPGPLLVERDDDSQLVDELRTLLRLMVQARSESRQEVETDKFFKRDVDRPGY